MEDLKLISAHILVKIPHFEDLKLILPRIMVKIPHLADLKLISARIMVKRRHRRRSILYPAATGQPLRELH